jgi:hypothetical protein
VHWLRYLREEVSSSRLSWRLSGIMARHDADTPRRCPFEAIQILNLPTNLETHVTHRYQANAFKLHRLPTPRPGQVLGLVGTNGIGAQDSFGQAQAQSRSIR